MPYCIYKVTNKVNNKIYIGFHTIKTTLDDGYMGSGKLIKRSLKYHGVENFEKEILKIFHYEKDAEAYEAELVNLDFIMRSDTYNISLGGNVTILFGENNDFYGKKHTDETIERIQRERNKTISKRGYVHKNNWHSYIDYHECYNFEQVRNILGFVSKRKIIKFFVENRDYCGFVDLGFQQKIENMYVKIIEHEVMMRKIRSEQCSLRFNGIPKSEEQRKKMSLAHKGRIHWWSNKINKNPEKIRKTAEKHRGMKRSEEAKNNISQAQKDLYERGYVNSLKGKKCYYNPETEEIGYFKEDEYPVGWLKGNPSTKKKVYYNPKTMVCKRFKEGTQPEGWLLGQPNNVRTKKKYIREEELQDGINELPL